MKNSISLWRGGHTDSSAMEKKGWYSSEQEVVNKALSLCLAFLGQGSGFRGGGHTDSSAMVKDGWSSASRNPGVVLGVCGFKLRI